MLLRDDYPNLLADLERNILRKSLMGFGSAAWPLIEPATKLKVSPHMEFLADLIQDRALMAARKERRIRHLLINVPPRSLKSTICIRWLIPFVWALEPACKFVVASHRDDLASGHIMAARDIIKSQWYQDRWGFGRKESDPAYVALRRDKDAKKLYGNSLGGQVQAFGMGNSLGAGGDIVVIDDAQNPEQALSDVESERVIENFKALMTRLDDPDCGLVIVIQQRLSTKDLTGHILSSIPEQFEHICLPALDDYPIFPEELKRLYKDGLLSPDHLSRDFIENQKGALLSKFAGMYGQQPSPPHGNIIQEEWLLRFDDEELPPAWKISWEMQVDTADEDTGDNDPFAFMVYLRVDDVRYCCFIHEGRYLLSGAIRKVGDIVSMFCEDKGGMIIRIEPKTLGKALRSLLNDQGFNATLSDNPKESKVERIKRVQPAIEAGKFRLPSRKSKYYAFWVEKFIDDAKNFPNGDDHSIDNLSAIMGKSKVFKMV
jgi:phage terminase large subunit-like protein